jgi:serine/threonine protein kinase
VLCKATTFIAERRTIIALSTITKAKRLDSILQTAGKYSLNRRIKSGSTCIVAEEVDKMSIITYVVKVMPFSEAIPKHLKQAIDREIRALRRVNSSHICKMYDIVK